MNKIEFGIIHDIFTGLDRQIGLHGGAPIGLVVCGGTALFALGLVHRTTKDVDVLGTVVETGKMLAVQKIEKLSEWLIEAAKTVGRDFGLPDNWLNIGPAPQVESGLPEGFEKRLVKKNYGRYLTIYFISRLDQIHFKLYAAIDRDDYHTQDLLALNPTEEEVETASKWTLTQDVSEGYRSVLMAFLREHGYESIASRI